MIARTKVLQERILDIKYGRVREGLKIGVPEIDEHIRFKKGFSIFIGHANVGKTTVVVYWFVMWAIKHNLKFLIWSSENTPQSILRKIIEFKMGMTIQQATDSQISLAVEWCDMHFKIIDVEDLYTYKQLLNEAKAIKDAWNYDAILIDPYNSLSKDAEVLKLNGNSHDYDYQVASELRLFSKHNNLAVYLNAHGVTSALRQVHHSGHEFEGLTKPLAMSDIEGGSKWSSRADDVYCIHRYVSHPFDWMYSRIHVLKIKENETGGRPTSHDDPIMFKMTKNNVGFEFLGRDLIHNTKPIQQLSL